MQLLVPKKPPPPSPGRSGQFREFLMQNYKDDAKKKQGLGQKRARRESGHFYNLPRPHEIMEAMKAEENVGGDEWNEMMKDPVLIGAKFEEMLPQWRVKLEEHDGIANRRSRLLKKWDIGAVKPFDESVAAGIHSATKQNYGSSLQAPGSLPSSPRRSLAGPQDGGEQPESQPQSRMSMAAPRMTLMQQPMSAKEMYDRHHSRGSVIFALHPRLRNDRAEHQRPFDRRAAASPLARARARPRNAPN